MAESRKNLIQLAGSYLATTVKDVTRQPATYSKANSGGGLISFWQDALTTIAAVAAFRNSENINVDAAIRLSMTNSWVHSDIMLISDRLAGKDAAPLVQKRKNGDEPEEIKNHPFHMLWQQPNALQSGSLMLKQLVQWYLLTGNAYMFIATPTAGTGEPKELWTLSAPQMRPMPETFRDGTGVFKGRKVIDYAYNINGKWHKMPGENIVHLRAPNPFDDWVGLSRLTALLTPIQLDQAQQKWHRDFFGKDNAVPTAIISLPKELDDDEYDTVKEEIRQQFGDNRKSAITRAGDLSVQVVSQTIESMAINQSREFTRDEIDRVFGIPEGLISGGLSGDSRLAAEIAFARNTIQPLIDYFCAEFTANIALYYGNDILISAPDVVPQDRALEMQEHTVYSLDRTINENRAKQNLKPLTGDLYENIAVRVLPFALKTPGDFAFTEEHQKTLDEKKKQADQMQQMMLQGGGNPGAQGAQGKPGNANNNAQPGKDDPNAPKKVGNLPGAQAPDQMAAQQAGKALTIKAGHTGVMLAFFLSHTKAIHLLNESVALGAVAPLLPMDELHLTLCYLGDSTEMADQKERIITAIKQYAKQARPVAGTISGIGRFTGDEGNDTNAVYASFDGPELPEWRQALIHALESTGLELDFTHGYTPHITLAYIPADTATPDFQLSATSLHFDTLTLAWGDERIDIPLHDSNTPEPEPETNKTLVIAQKAELAQWRKVAGKAIKAGQEPRAFQCNVIPVYVQEYLKVMLPIIGLQAFTDASDMLEASHSREPHTSPDDDPSHLAKMNTNHDELGRFASGSGSSGGVLRRESPMPDQPNDKRAQMFSKESGKYREFTDHDQTAEIEGRYKRQWAESVTPDEKSAINGYVARGYVAINNHLRAGAEANSLVKAEIEHIDEAIGKTRVPYNITVHRGGEFQGTLTEGMEFRDKGYVSTSLLPHTAQEFARNKTITAGKDSAVLFKIKIPQGHPGAYLDALNNEEHEMLLPRNTRFRVSKVSTEQINGTDVRTAELEVVE